MPGTTNGPTLNQNYNNVLAVWAAGGFDSKPECEDCGCDLTGQKVIDAGSMWLCVKCDEKPAVMVPSEPREDFHADL